MIIENNMEELLSIYCYDFSHMQNILNNITEKGEFFSIASDLCL